MSKPSLNQVFTFGPNKAITTTGWTKTTSTKYPDGYFYTTAGVPNLLLYWEINKLVTTGRYEVQVHYVSGTNRSTAVPCKIIADDSQETFLIDQTKTLLLPNYLSIGTFNFTNSNIYPQGVYFQSPNNQMLFSIYGIKLIYKGPNTTPIMPRILSNINQEFIVDNLNCSISNGWKLNYDINSINTFNYSSEKKASLYAQWPFPKNIINGLYEVRMKITTTNPFYFTILHSNGNQLYKMDTVNNNGFTYLGIYNFIYDPNIFNGVSVTSISNQLIKIDAVKFIYKGPSRTKSLDELKSIYINRGCWNDCGGPYATDCSIRAVSNNYINMNDWKINPSEWLITALRIASDNKFNTIAFQEGNKLFMGNYDKEGYRYDKFGPNTFTYDCLEFGAKNVNKVYSILEPVLSTKPLEELKAMYIDRGCWNECENTSTTECITAYNYYINMNDWNLPPEQWLERALRTADFYGLDTIAFKKSNMFFMYNYDITGFQYDKFGRNTFTNNCLEFGEINVNRVYSKIVPAVESNAMYIDRGCWNDCGGPYVRDCSLKAVSNNYINMKDWKIPEDKWLEKALRMAYFNKFNTIAFQEGYKLFMGNYNDYGFYRYDKFGPNTFTYECLKFGEENVNRVYSIIEPVLSTKPLNELKAMYVDRGCWNDCGGPLVKDCTNRAVYKYYYNMNDWNIPTEKWLERALRTADFYGLDTFAFQNGNMFFMGFYDHDINGFQYDKFGRNTFTNNCLEFGEEYVNRVYSKNNPSNLVQQFDNQKDKQMEKFSNDSNKTLKIIILLILILLISIFLLNELKIINIDSL